MKLYGKDFITSVAMAGFMSSLQAAQNAEPFEVSAARGTDDLEIDTAREAPKCEFEIDNFLLAHQQFKVPGYDVELKLRRAPKVVVRDYISYCIDDLGIGVSPEHEDPWSCLAHNVVRKFLGCFRKAQQRTMSVEDRQVWLRLLADFDTDNYFEISAAPVKALGVIKKLEPKYAVIQWSDDQSEDEKVDGILRERLSVLNAGDIFSATVKFVNGKLSYIDNVLPCDV